MTGRPAAGSGPQSEPIQSLFPVLEKLNEGALVSDARGRVRWTNRAMHALFGASYRDGRRIGRDELVTTRLMPMIQGRKDAISSLFFPGNNSRSPEHARFSITSPSGKKHFIEYFGFVAVSGFFSGYRFEFFRDISGTDAPVHDKEMALREIRSFIDRFPGAYYLIDPSGTIVGGSPATSDVTGYPPERLIGQRIQTSPLLSRDQLVRAARLIENHRRGVRDSGTPFVLTRSDGHTRHVRLTLHPIRLSGGLCVLGLDPDPEADESGAAREREYLRNLEFLARTSRELLDLGPERNHYSFVVSRLRELYPDAIAVVTSVDEEAGEVRVEAMAGDEPRDAFTRLAGADLVGMTFSLTPEVAASMRTGELTAVDGIRDLSMGTWSDEFCRRIADAFDIGTIYGIGFAWEGRLYGDAVLILKKGTVLKDKTVIEAFVREVAISLRRRQAEEDLRRSSTFSGNILESMHDAVAVVDTSGRFTLWNRAMEEFTGFSRNMVFTTPLLPGDLFPADANVPIDRILSRVQQGEAFRHELRHIRFANGRERHCSAAYLPLRSPRGAIEGVIAIVRDLSESREASAALKESEEKYRDLVESVNSIILRMDMDGRITFFNEFAERFFGFGQEEVIGMSIFSTIVPREESSGRDLRAYFAHMFAHPEQHIASENENVKKCGTRVWIAWRNRPLYDETGRCTGFLSVGNDITERKLANALIRENEVKYRTLFESAFDGISFIKDGRFVTCNARHEAIFGCSSSAVAGKSPVDFSPEVQPDGSLSRHKCAEYLARALSGEAQFFEWRYLRADGTPVDTEISLTKVEVPGDVLILAVVRDITERKRAGEALRESERKYRQIAEGSFDGIVTVDPARRVLYASPSTRRILGYRPEEMAGEDFARYLDPSERVRLEMRFAEMLKGGAMEGFQVRMRSRTGSCVFVDMNGNPIVREGEIEGIQIIIRDISDRKRAEEAEREKEFIDYLLSASLNNTPLGMVLFRVKEDEVRIIDWNYAAEAIFGWSRAEVLDRNFLDLLPAPGSERQLAWFVDQILEERKPHNFTAGCTTADGRNVLVKWFNTPITDRKTESLYIMSLAEDITERAKAEDAIRESEVKYRTTIDSMGDPVHVIERDFTIVLVNRAFKLWFEDLDLSPEVVGMPITEALPAIHEEIMDEYRWVFETGEMLLGKERMRFGETEFVMETRKIPVFERGEVVRVVTAIRDVTSSVKLEQLKMEAFVQIEKNMEQFAVLNDHIRNPLQAIVGFADLEGGDLAEKIFQQAMEIDAIIKQLDIGWIESQKIREFLRKHYGVS